jgi:restriction system protein
MSWQHFELLVGDYFKQRGFEIDERGGGLPDGGIDLIARRGTDEYVIQCKQWKAIRVGVVPVRELYGVVAARRAAGGFFVTSGSFTAEAIQFAKGLSIELIDGEKLASSIAQHRQAKTVTEAATVNFRSIASGVPSCPRCEAKMVMRTARTGPHPGDQFWGCTRFPACGGTRPA